MTTHATDITKLMELPNIKAAIEAAAASNETQAAIARKIVLDELAEAEAALVDMAALGETIDADVAALRRQLHALGERRDQHASQIHAIDARARELSRKLNAEHGGNMINAAVNQLRIQATNLREKAERQRQLRRMAPNRWGDLVESEDPEAMARAAELDNQAEQIEAAIRDIDFLIRQPIAPQEIWRRIAEAVKPLGMKFTVEEIPSVNSWRITGWTKGKKAA